MISSMGMIHSSYSLPVLRLSLASTDSIAHWTLDSGTNDKPIDLILRVLMLHTNRTSCSSVDPESVRIFRVYDDPRLWIGWLWSDPQDFISHLIQGQL
jgi:hypothetical protein